MKKSEQIELEAMQEENDFKAWQLHSQAKRENKMEYFRETLLPEICQSERVEWIDDRETFFKIKFKEGFIVDYYPKADRIFWCGKGKWMHNGYGELEKMI